MSYPVYFQQDYLMARPFQQVGPSVVDNSQYQQVAPYVPSQYSQLSQPQVPQQMPQRMTQLMDYYHNYLLHQPTNQQMAMSYNQPQMAQAPPSVSNSLHGSMSGSISGSISGASGPASNGMGVSMNGSVSGASNQGLPHIQTNISPQPSQVETPQSQKNSGKLSPPTFLFSLPQPQVQNSYPQPASNGMLVQPVLPRLQLQTQLYSKYSPASTNVYPLSPSSVSGEIPRRDSDNSLKVPGTSINYNSLVSYTVSPSSKRRRRSDYRQRKNEDLNTKFTCNTCGKQFPKPYNLKSHMKTHSTERPYKCAVCPKTFARSHDRKRHEHLHDGIKNFKCEGYLKDGMSKWGCGKTFARSDALARHFRTETGWLCIKPLMDEARDLDQGRLHYEHPLYFHHSIALPPLRPQ